MNTITQVIQFLNSHDKNRYEITLQDLMEKISSHQIPVYQSFRSLRHFVFAEPELSAAEDWPSTDAPIEGLGSKHYELCIDNLDEWGEPRDSYLTKDAYLWLIDQSIRRYLKTESNFVSLKGISAENFFAEVNKLAAKHPSAKHKVERFEKPVMLELVRCAGFGSLVDQLRFDDSIPFSFSEITIVKDKNGRYGAPCYSNAEFILEGIDCKNLRLEIDRVSEAFYPEAAKAETAGINGKTKNSYLALIRVLAEAAELDIEQRGLASALERAAKNAECKVGYDFIVAALRESSSNIHFDLTNEASKKAFFDELEKFR